MLRPLLLYLSERETPKRFLARSPLGRKVARRFIAGEEFADGVRPLRQLTAEGFAVTLDHLGESVHESRDAEEACQVYLDLLDRLASEDIHSHISIKLTQLGLAIDEVATLQHVKALAERAARYHNFVRIDMESSAYTDATLRVFRAAGAPSDVLGIVIQSYLYRSEKDVDELLKNGSRIRLCKGAYNEAPEVAYSRKEEVDQNYIRLMEKLLLSGHYHAIATHDPGMISATRQFAAAHGIATDCFEFQMLYGIRRRLQRELLRQGYRVRVYVPYGSQWYPYFMRRLAERPANLFFLIRNMLRR